MESNISAKRHERLLTTADLAQMLGVSEKTIANWRYRREIPFLRINGGLVRYRLADILTWLDQQAQKVTA